ncbi:MAG: hypothetical protein ACE5RI_06030 [Candidatus Nitrosomaritimum yanchengensis]
MNELNTVIVFLLGLFTSGIIIYFVTKLFGESKGIGTAIVTALVGTVVYTISYHLFETGWISAIAAGIVWLIALSSIYKIGFLKSLVISVAIWISATMVGFFLPTVSGPL